MSLHRVTRPAMTYLSFLNGVTDHQRILSGGLGLLHKLPRTTKVDAVLLS